ncbi:hypothetical protein K438DRAFT_1964285 [Mycena galopus ATCC 62051]|nr:hypothetical protein K438DRAFT_1964285 [Mycena galopus ATCC 62051]
MSSDQPALVAREARSIHGGLKALLAGDVWANYREADFQRKNLRRRYLHLLLLHPNAREARDAGTHLWMQTSYAFIALYKQRLAALSTNSANNSNNNNNNNGEHKDKDKDKASAREHKETNRKQIETRKLLQRFRQFLADEDRFWRALVGRVQRAYGVVLPATNALVALPPELLGPNANGNNTHAGGEEDAGGGGGAEDRMNHFGFPVLGDEGGASLLVDPRTASSVLSKALVCLGDIARYREQYKFPPKGKPAHPHAQALYLAAHALAPGEGNAAHQLAILAGYESDTLASLTWYLRALCVRAPFDTAGENLAGVLARVVAVERRLGLDAGKAKDNNKRRAPSTREYDYQQGGEGEDEDEDEEPRVRIDRLRKELVLLHALWRDRSTPPTQTLALSAHAARAFGRLVAARALPEELIVRVVLLAQGAVWVGRMVVLPAPPPPLESRASGNDNSSGDGHGPRGKEREKGARGKHARGRSEPAPPNPSAENTNTNAKTPGKETPKHTQAAHLAHLLALHTALLDVGVRELGEVDVYAVPASGAGRGGGAGVAPAVAVAAAGRGGGGGRGRKNGRRGGEGAAVAPAAVVPGGAGAVGGMGMGTGANLAERISAEFRRTLPALRVASKWVLANWGWVGVRIGEEAAAANANANVQPGKGQGEGDDGEEEAELAAQRVRFWAAYAEFLRRLAKTFPAGLLPKLTVDVRAEDGLGLAEGEVEEGGEGEGEGEEVELELELEEDVDVRGWLPLRGLMGGPCPLPPHLEVDASSEGEIEGDFLSELGSGNGKGKGKGKGMEADISGKPERARRTVGLREEVHPNVEQLMRIADLLRDARRVVGLEGSPLALYGGQFVVKGVEAAKPAGVVPPAPVPFSTQKHYVPVGGQQPALNPNAQPYSYTHTHIYTPLEIAMDADDLDAEDDAMTEQTSRTDDDLLHDAFSFLNRAESGSEAAEDQDASDDEIVWDLRDAPVSPMMPTATARQSPKTPMRLAPIGPPARGTGPIGSPLSAPLPLSPFRLPQQQLQPQQPITPGTQIPATTALDLLNTFAKKPVAAIPTVGVGMGGPGGPAGDGLLFGTRAAVPQTQSIWSASRDERGLMFASGASGSGGGVGQQQQPLAHQHQHPHQHTQQQYQGLAQSPGYAEHGPPHHHRFASQDLAASQGSTIWASSYPSASQHHVPTNAGPNSSFGPPPPTHQRVVSSSMAAAQLFPSDGDQYGYGPLSAPAPHYIGGMPPNGNGDMSVLYATSGQGQGFAAQQGHGFGLGQAQHGHGHGHGQHARHLSLDPRAAAFHAHPHGQPVVSMSQLWGNVG